MLSRAQRIHLPTQFRRVIRRGAKAHRPTLVCYAVSGETTLNRYGFVVSKSVGPAVTRNLVKRRLRAIAAELGSPTPVDVVIRALPEAASAEWDQLRSDFTEALAHATKAAQ